METNQTGDITVPIVRPSLWQLYKTAFILGATGFGGVLPLLHRMLVEKRQWLSDARFAELLGLCQFLPGGNAVNLCVAMGVEFHGVKGGFTALTGLLTAPVIIIILLGNTWTRFHDNPLVSSLFAGISAAAAGLIIATGIKLLAAMPRKWSALVVLAGVILSTALFRIPLLPVLVIAVPVSALLASLSERS